MLLELALAEQSVRGTGVSLSRTHHWSQPVAHTPSAREWAEALRALFFLGRSLAASFRHVNAEILSLRPSATAHRSLVRR